MEPLFGYDFRKSMIRVGCPDERALHIDLRTCFAQRAFSLVRDCLTLELLAYVGSRDFDQPTIDEAWQHPLVPEYVEYMSRAGWHRSLERWPGVEQVINIALRNWLDSLGKFFSRYAESQAALATHVNMQPHSLRITKLRTGLSDCHSGGESVFEVTLEGGRKLLYKPRSQSSEKLASKNSAALSSALQLPTVSIPRVLDCGSYGYADLVEHHSFQSADEIRSYYESAGLVFSILTFIGASDCHHENVVASDRGPVIVDFETLGSIESYRNCALLLYGDLGNLAPETVSGLLPDIKFKSLTSAYDRGGFTGFVKYTRKRSRIFRRRYQGTNVPTMRGDAAPLDDYCDIFVEAALDAEAKLRRVDLGPSTDSHRVVLRATSTYYQALKYALSPLGLKRKEWKGRLGDVLKFRLPSKFANTILESEIASLSQLDIPRFVVKDRKLTLNNEFVADINEPAKNLQPPFTRGISGDDLRQRLSALKALPRWTAP